MRDAEIEQIIKQLTSFYREYLPIGSDFEKMIRHFIETFEFMWEDVNYYHNHITVETAPTLKKIPYALLDIKPALYDKTIAQKINEQPLEAVIAFLNENKYYSELTFSERKTRDPIVYSMRLKIDYFKPDELRLFDDYFLRDNRIYLMPSFILQLTSHLSELHAVDIRYDNYMLEQKWGHTFEVESGNFLPRYQYRDVISAFRRMLLSNLTIRDMVDAVKLATKWEPFDIQDIKTPNLPLQRKRLYDEWLVSPAKFLVLIGEQMVKDKMLLNILISLMDEGKEAQVNYMILFLIYRLDIWDFSKADEVVPTYLYFPKEKLLTEEKTVQLRRMKTKEFLNLPHNYDVGRHYDWLLTHDYPGRGNLPVLMDMDEAITDAGILTDAPWFFNSDYFELRVVEFPKIPRGLTVTESNGVITFTFDENKDGTKQYELYGKIDESHEYQLIEQKQKVENDTNTIIHDAGVSGMRYYKIRAVCYDKTSLFTLTTDVTTL